MTAIEVADLLNGKVESWNAATSWQRGAFVLEMQDKQYGWDAITLAWQWFLAGWEAGQL